MMESINTGLAITTYFRNGYDKERLSIFRRSIRSLISSGYGGRIFIVDDGSETFDHIAVIREEDTSNRIAVIFRHENGGIARAKNTCIRTLLEAGCDTGFLADDDIEYSPGWDARYVETMSRFKIPHLSMYIDKGFETVEEDGGVVRATPHVNGCFLTFTRELIDRVGYFKILDYKYGHEHSNFSVRCLNFGEIPFFGDIAEREKYLNIIPESIGCKSLTDIDQDAVDKNEAVALSEFCKEPCIE